MNNISLSFRGCGGDNFKLFKLEESIDYKKGTHLVGYYEQKEPYFNGITLDIKEKGFEKELK